MIVKLCECGRRTLKDMCRRCREKAVMKKREDYGFKRGDENPARKKKAAV